MDRRVVVQELRRAIHGGLHFVGSGTRARTRQHRDRAGEFVDDPVIDLVEQKALVGAWHASERSGHHFILL
jgi:hypothetical protein